MIICLSVALFAFMGRGLVVKVVDFHSMESEYISSCQPYQSLVVVGRHPANIAPLSLSLCLSVSLCLSLSISVSVFLAPL